MNEPIVPVLLSKGLHDLRVVISVYDSFKTVRAVDIDA